MVDLVSFQYVFRTFSGWRFSKKKLVYAMRETLPDWMTGVKLIRDRFVKYFTIL